MIFCRYRWLPLVVVWLVLAGLGGRPAPAGARVAVVVSLPPQQYFVRQLAGSLATVTVMVPPGADPHTYEPRPSQLRRLAGAQLYFTIGIEFERLWLPRWQQLNPALRLVPADRGLPKLPLPGSGEAAGHPDPHVWLSPRLVARMARTMSAALVAVDPAHEDDYRRRLAAWEERLTALDRELRRLTAARRRRHAR